jgi:hypothetical protein
MDKSKKKLGKHNRLKRKKLISKEKLCGNECHEPNDLVSKLEHQESDTGMIMPYFTLYRVLFFPPQHTQTQITFALLFHNIYSIYSIFFQAYQHVNVMFDVYTCGIMFGYCQIVFC